MNSQYLKKAQLPDAPGVYIFRDIRKRPLYIGRATSLKDRVKSYFAIDLIETRGPRIVDMITKAKSVTHEKTDSVLEAIILESALIKRYQPDYNVDERDDKSSNYVIITDEPWPRVFLARARDLDSQIKEGKLPYKIKAQFGPYIHGGLIKEALKILRKIFPFKDKKSYDARHDAFYQAIGRSPGITKSPQLSAAPFTRGNSELNARRRYQNTIKNLILFFEGKKDLLRKNIELEMKRNAKAMKFEEAGEAKRMLYAVDHIRDISLIKQNNTNTRIDTNDTNNNKREFRIEAYDIAHMAGKNVVGAYTVSINGELAPAEYRKFKISVQANNDVAGLVEILSRRLNHTEWNYPDLIVVDGNEVQVHAAEAVLKSRRISIPVVGVTKDERHVASRLIGDPRLTEKYSKEIISVNAEAHRFAIAFHRKKRRKGFI